MLNNLSILLLATNPFPQLKEKISKYSSAWGGMYENHQCKWLSVSQKEKKERNSFYALHHFSLWLIICYTKYVQDKRNKDMEEEAKQKTWSINILLAATRTKTFIHQYTKICIEIIFTQKWKKRKIPLNILQLLCIQVKLFKFLFVCL